MMLINIEGMSWEILLQYLSAYISRLILSTNSSTKRLEKSGHWLVADLQNISFQWKIYAHCCCYCMHFNLEYLAEKLMELSSGGESAAIVQFICLHSQLPPMQSTCKQIVQFCTYSQLCKFCTRPQFAYLYIQGQNVKLQSQFTTLIEA